MNARNIICALSICLCLGVLGASADVPHFINFQGNLTDAIGHPISGTRTIQFTIYSDSTVPYYLWTETQPSVEITDGLFRVSLGVVTALPPTLFDGTTRWLGIRVSPDAGELSPRQKIVSVPYSYRTLRADTANYALNAFSAALSTEANHAANADTANYARSAAPDSDWTIAGGNIYRNTGNVGIGTTSPVYKLSVEGQAISGVNCIAPGQYSTVSGGYNNKARGRYAVVAGGGGGTAADSNSAIGYYSAIGGGAKQHLHRRLFHRRRRKSQHCQRN